MSKKVSVVLLSLISISGCAGLSVDTQVTEEELSGMCLFAKAPKPVVRYQETEWVKHAKGSYGSVAEELPKFAAMVKASGGNAVINYTGSQRFGFWPWRFVRPVLRGTAVKIENPEGLSCQQMGGKSVAEVMATNIEP